MMESRVERSVVAPLQEKNLVMWLEAHIMLHLKFYESVMVQKRMSGVLEWSFTFC